MSAVHHRKQRKRRNKRKAKTRPLALTDNTWSIIMDKKPDNGARWMARILEKVISYLDSVNYAGTVEMLPVGRVANRVAKEWSFRHLLNLPMTLGVPIHRLYLDSGGTNIQYVVWRNVDVETNFFNKVIRRYISSIAKEYNVRYISGNELIGDEECSLFGIVFHDSYRESSFIPKRVLKMLDRYYDINRVRSEGFALADTYNRFYGEYSEGPEDPSRKVT